MVRFDSAEERLLISFQLLTYSIVRWQVFNDPFYTFVYNSGLFNRVNTLKIRMAGKFRAALKVIADEINKQQVFNNTRPIITSTIDRAQEKFSLIRKQLNNEITPSPNGNNVTPESRGPLPKRVVKYWQWYQHLTGLDKVELAKEEVIITQDKLFKCQDERRYLNSQVILINDKLKEIYGELLQTKRDDPRYVQLTIIENKCLQDQARIVAELNLQEKEERDRFTLLATAIKEYHDTQTINAQKYKYLSILASAALAIISLTGSMIYNNKRIKDVRNVINQAQVENNNLLSNGLNNLNDKLDTKLSEILQKVKPVDNIPANQNQIYSSLTSWSHWIIYGSTSITILLIKKLFS